MAQVQIVAPEEQTTVLHVGRTTFAAVISQLLAHALHMPEPYWATVTTIVVMQSTLCGWVRRNICQAGRTHIRSSDLHHRIDLPAFGWTARPTCDSQRNFHEAMRRDDPCRSLADHQQDDDFGDSKPWC